MGIDSVPPHRQSPCSISVNQRVNAPLFDTSPRPTERVIVGWPWPRRVLLFLCAPGRVAGLGVCVWRCVGDARGNGTAVITAACVAIGQHAPPPPAPLRHLGRVMWDVSLWRCPALTRPDLTWDEPTGLTCPRCGRVCMWGGGVMSCLRCPDLG